MGLPGECGTRIYYEPTVMVRLRHVPFHAIFVTIILFGYPHMAHTHLPCNDFSVYLVMLFNQHLVLIKLYNI